jgi:hypothetical protein
MQHLVFRSLLLAALLGAIPAIAAADPTVYVETDPATFAFRGYSAHLRASPAAHPRWVIGAGAYGLDLPAPMTELAPSNRDEGWDVRITLGYGLFVDRFLRAPGTGPFAGVQVAAQHLRIRNHSLDPADARAVTLLAMPRVGYLWRPFEAGFYLSGWLGLGVTGVVAGDTTVGSDRYRVLPIIPYAAVHVGWSFE